MSRMIKILAVVDRDDKWDEMKARYDSIDHSAYVQPDPNADGYEYFCYQEPLANGMFKAIEHTEVHDDNSGESFYFFDTKKLTNETGLFVVVETP